MNDLSSHTANSLVDFAALSFMGQSVGVWVVFIGIILILLALDLGLFNRRDQVIGARQSLVQAGGYFILAILFGGWLTSDMGVQHGIDYYTAYLIELSLSLDNLFVMSLILSYFAVPRQYQHRVLFWGIIGVLVMRGVMIAAGTALIQMFSWVLFIFAGFLVITGIKMLFIKAEDAEDLNDSALIRFFMRHLRFTREISGHQFFVRLPHPMTQKPLLFATPLFMALICIEFMDVVFALDSVPAVLAITTEPFVVYTSNIFAILGLRSMYFALAVMLDRFKYLKYAMAVVLIFIGLKVFYAHVFDKINPFISLGITVTLLTAGVVVSLLKKAGEARSNA